uniref:FAD-dependent oxidoreductase n=1 Tax=Tepidiforma sp. TaxID=2682230 RepID=UPI002ADE7763
MTAPDRFDVAVIGGGAAGVAAALEAASLGAAVALVESARPGGSCVHHTCIPTTILLESAAAFVAAREAAVAGIFTAGEALQLGRANDRAAALVRQLAAGVETALRRARVTVLQGRAAFRQPGLLEVSGSGPLAADAVVVAAGCAWEPPAIPGLPPDRLVTPDVVQSWREPPASCLILGGGPSGGLFAIEYAVLLALAGSAVTLAAPGPLLCPGFDDDLQPVIADLLAAVGVTARAGHAPVAAEDRCVRLAGPGGECSVEADVVLAADPRVPSLEGLCLERAGLQPRDGAIPVDPACATGIPGIYAAGDVTGTGMLSSTAALQGRVA